MPNSFVIKITGSAGQGIKTSGLIIGKALKRSGYFTFVYSEYPSLIRGGHNIVQIEVAPFRHTSVSKRLDVLLALDELSIKLHAHEIAANGVLIYDEGATYVADDLKAKLEQNQVNVIGIPLLELARKGGGSGIMKNTVSIGALWKTLGLEIGEITKLINETYAGKKPEVIETNLKAAQEGFDYVTHIIPEFGQKFKADTDPQDDLLITGNEAIGLGAIAAGVRLYSSYPMTPAGSILTFLAEEGTKTGMIVKQAEDEITSVNMVVGASYAGTRAMCGTSGGGFDLMTEAISLAGMTETPLLMILGQRPGPATGLPTWTAQSDLNLATYGGHGEFPRIVLAASDPRNAYQLVQKGYNLAETFQTPVILLSDEFLGESYYDIPDFLSDEAIGRGKILNVSELQINPKINRYDKTDADPISPRWFPGDKLKPFLANSDEHFAWGYSTEDAAEVATSYAGRMRKQEIIRQIYHEFIVETFNNDTHEFDLTILTWGSTAEIIKSVAKDFTFKLRIVDLQMLQPIDKQTLLAKLFPADATNKKLVVVENNYTGQLANLLQMELGKEFADRINKYDGRPFFSEELVEKITNFYQSKQA